MNNVISLSKRASEVEIGSIVRLKSGGPIMTVIGHDTDWVGALICMAMSTNEADIKHGYGVIEISVFPAALVVVTVDAE